MAYSVGDLITVTGTWTDAAGDAVDPAVVLAEYRDPSGNVTSLTYGVDAALVKDGVGNYSVDIDINAAGRWHYRFWSTGMGQAAHRPREFYVFPSALS